MPTDVKLGEGYDGAILAQRFPNQYRDPRLDVQEQSGGYYQYPGAVSGQPRFTDPDQGRPMAMVDMPGVGKVMVPVEDAAAMMGNVNAVVPVEHSMVGQVYPAEHEMAEFLDEQQLRGLGDADHKSAVNWVAQKLSRAAGKAAVEALNAIKAGKFKTVQQFEAYVQQVVTRVAARIEAHLRAKLAALPSFRDSAIKAAIDSARGKAASLLSQTPQPTGSSDWPGSMMGMGGLTESIGSLVAGSELNELNKSISRLHSATVDSYNRLDELEAARKQTEELAKLPGNSVTGPFGVSIPTPQGVSLMQGQAAIREGYNSLTGFHYMTSVLTQTFSLAAGELRPVYSGIDGLLVAFKNWDDTWRRRVRPLGGQAALWDKIQAEHGRRYAAATGNKPMDPNNPIFLTTAQEAVEALVGLKVSKPGVGGMADVGITVIVVAIASAVALIAIVVSAVLIVREFNLKTRVIHEERMAYEANKEAERKEYMAKRQAEGASVQKATGEWNELKKKADEEQKKKEEALPSGAGDVFAGAAKYLALAAAAIGAIIVLPKLLGG
jgi:hypothetical protein